MHESEATMHESEVLERKKLPLGKFCLLFRSGGDAGKLGFAGVFAMARRLLRRWLA